MKILLTGGTGKIGRELRRTLAPLGPVSAPSRADLDLEDPEGLRAAVRSGAPDVIVNAAAHTDVDGAEDDARRAEAVNAGAPAVLAEEAARSGAAIVHFSTDYVFDGEKGGPYVEDDPTNPLSVYGRTKLEGEEAVRGSGAPHLIFRTSWVFGLRRSNFLTAMLDLFRTEEVVSVVDDQVGSPTWCRWVAEAVARAMAGRQALKGGGGGPGGRSGTYHLAGAGSATWYDLARAIRKRLEAMDGVAGELRVERIEPVPASEYPRRAARPRNSALDGGKARRELEVEPLDWEAQLSLCLEGLRTPGWTSGSGG